MRYTRLWVWLICAVWVGRSVEAAIKVACVGDSITWGQGAREEGHPEAVYPAVLQSLLGAGYDVGNFGASGSTLLSRGSLGQGAGDAYINREQFVPSKNFNADIILIMLGTNDGHNQLTNQTAGLSLWTNDCDALIAQYTNGKAIPPTIILATAAWPPSSAFVSQDVIGNRINPMIRSYASQRGYLLVDIWNTTYNTPYDGNKGTHDATDWWYDPVHPYIYGYNQIANAFYAGLTQAPATGSPSVSVSAASPVGYTTATLNGNLTSTGSLPTTVRFVWGATDAGTNLGSWANSANLGIQTVGPVYVGISSLAAPGAYNVRVYASNSMGVAWSSVSSFTTQPTNFTAYNDVGWAAPQPSTRITTNTVLNTSGALVDYATGASLDAHVSMTSSNGGFFANSGGAAPAGSPAALMIPANVVNSDFYCAFDSATMSVTGLDPTRLYTIVMYADRGGDPFASDYTSRYTTVTISGTTSFQNNSSTGAVNQAASSATMKTGVPHGEVFRFDQVNPGGDGAVSFSLNGFKPCLNSFLVQTPSVSGTNSPPSGPSNWTVFNDALWMGTNETYNGTYGTNSPTFGVNGLLTTVSGVVLTASVSFNTNSAASLAYVAAQPVWPVGTDAYNLFYGHVGSNNVSDWASGVLGMTLSGLNSNKQYTVALYCSRLADGTQYTDRFTVVTISSVDSFSNNSSVGAPRSTATVASDTTKLISGLSAGLVARYDFVRPGVDGTIAFSLLGTGTNGQSHGYLNAFMVMESNVSAGIADVNSNGMDDAWEQLHFGGLSQPNAGPTQDFDTDGFDNYSEYRAGTDPQNSSSRLELTNVAAPTGTPGQVVLQWGGVTSKTYSIELRTNLAGGTWTTLQSGIPGSSENSFTGTTAALRSYWRIKVE